MLLAAVMTFFEVAEITAIPLVFVGHRLIVNLCTSYWLIFGSFIKGESHWGQTDNAL
jgi:hypothetical protein